MSTVANTPEQRRHIRLLDHDADLAGAVPAEDRERARQALVSPVLRIPGGEIDVDTLGLPDDASSLVLVRGLIASDVVLAQHELSELLIEGDVLLPFQPSADGLPSRRRLTALDTTYVAALDQRFMRAAAAWPSLLVEIHRRLGQQEHRIAVHGVICQLPRVEQRVLAVMHHLATRTGKVRGEGTHIPIHMTHQALGRLIGAQRPTVSLAVKRLGEEGRLQRRDDGTWLLPTGFGDPADLPDGLLER